MSFKRVDIERLYHLDLIRLFATIYVVFYHYCFRGYAKGNFSILKFSPLEDFSEYGYLGVELFFIISGFIILISARNSDLKKFYISRFRSLNPAFWFSVLLTSFIVFIFGYPLFQLTYGQVLLNLITMFNEFLGVEHVDGVYWSLVVELKFYFLIAIILFFNLIRYIRFFAWVLLSIAIIQIIIPFAEAPYLLKIVYYVCFASKGTYFVAGMFIYFMKSEKKLIKNLLPILLAYVVSNKIAHDDTFIRNERYFNSYDENVVMLIITLFFIIMFLVGIDKLKPFNKKFFLKLGILTYPLYLLHQNIGFIMFNKLKLYINKWFLLSSVIIFMLILSYVVNKYIEIPLANYLKEKLKQNNIFPKSNPINKNSFF
ncbi:acyltransferase [Winogradskyella sp. SYSU M77433]|uniref:acyltransferase family protein n=1 Tax=Winogradskyella sp. SYSU M77433 TaxID=3042722 RepID=UPI00247FFDA7|nr:acyltransferase [Winogradskyella sp. SYSU M77433]MDH7913951.1 acyltransferase [Winogradskyella sp. SYSU M77433]